MGGVFAKEKRILPLLYFAVVKRRVVLLILAASSVAFCLPPGARVVYTPFGDAKPILETLSEIAPPELRSAPVEKREAFWDEWTKKRDVQVRDRLAQSD